MSEALCHTAAGSGRARRRSAVPVVELTEHCGCKESVCQDLQHCPRLVANCDDTDYTVAASSKDCVLLTLQQPVQQLWSPWIPTVANGMCTVIALIPPPLNCSTPMLWNLRRTEKSKRTYKPEEIVAKLCQVNVLHSEGSTIARDPTDWRER